MFKYILINYKKIGAIVIYSMRNISYIMVFLEKKKLKGNTYWYASKRGLVDGKIKRTWQEYLGTTETIIECVRKSKELSRIKLKSFQYGKTAALLSISDELNFINIVNNHTHIHFF